MSTPEAFLLKRFRGDKVQIITANFGYVDQNDIVHWRLQIIIMGIIKGSS